MEQADDLMYGLLEGKSYDGSKPLNHEIDMLQDIWNRQCVLMNRYFAENLKSNITCSSLIAGAQSDDEATQAQFQRLQNDLIANTCNFIAEEAFEIKRNFNYKSWKRPFKPDMEAAKEEIIDTLHFVMQAAIFAGMTADELHQRYCNKNAINHTRQDKPGGYEKKPEDV